MEETSQSTDKSTCSPASEDFLSDLDGPECLTISQFSPEDSPVNPSLTQDDEKVRQIIAISGRKCYESYLKSSQPTSLQKMFVGLFLLNPDGISIKRMPIWKEKATKSSRRLFFQLVLSVPRINAIESGSLLTIKPSHHVPTPTAQDYIERNPTRQDKAAKFNPQTNKAMSLDRWVNLYPTPQARDFMPAHSQEYIAEKRAQGHGMKNLNDYVRFPDMYATPHSNCHTGAGKHGTGGLNLQTQIGGKLNPRWVEWLMGYPEGWTVLSPSEMQSSRKSRRTSAGASLNLTDWLAEL